MTEKWSVEVIGKHDINNEHSVTLLKVSYEDKLKAKTKREIVEWLAENTYYSPTQTGVEGCPGQWYLDYVEVVYISYAYGYALVEVHGKLDV